MKNLLRKISILDAELFSISIKINSSLSFVVNFSINLADLYRVKRYVVE